MTDYLDCSATGCSNIQSAVVTDSYVASTSTATIICANSNRDVGDSIEVSLGYTGNKPKVFEGYVKSVELKEPERLYTITAANVLIRAVDYFLASTNPDTPFSRNHISAENLVGDLMAEAGITNYTGQASGLTLGIEDDIEVNLASAYDFSRFLADLLAFHIYADVNGKVHFDDTKPYPTGGGSVATLNKTNTISMVYSESDRDLRNRVVVYGSDGIFASSQQSSPHLPSGFYKSVVIASPTIIHSSSVAKQIANYNLNKLNRLTKRVSIAAIGNPSIQCRDNVQVVNSDLGLNDTAFVYSVEHNFSKAGYITSIEGRLA